MVVTYYVRVTVDRMHQPAQLAVLPADCRQSENILKLQNERKRKLKPLPRPSSSKSPDAASNLSSGHPDTTCKKAGPPYHHSRRELDPGPERILSQ